MPETETFFVLLISYAFFSVDLMCLFNRERDGRERERERGERWRERGEMERGEKREGGGEEMERDREIVGKGESKR